MPTFTGMVHDFLTPTPISFAEVETDRLTIRHGSWIYEATSCDGFYYEGHYGERRVDPDRVLRCWLYPGPDGSKIIYTYWHHRVNKSTQGESVFRLFPSTRPPEGPAELPEEWDLVSRTLETQAHLIPDAPLKLVLIHNRWTGYIANKAVLQNPGLYVLFYGSGMIARIGQASCSLAQRLPDYEANADGWFCFRWVGVIPVCNERKDLITPLEDYLLAALKPPENVRGVV